MDEEKKQDANTPGQHGSGGCTAMLAGVAVLIIALFVIGVDWESAGNYCDVPSFAIVGGLVLSGWLIFPGYHGSIRALKILIRGSTPSAEEARRAMWFCASGIGLAFISGVIGTLIGVINMLSFGMDDPGTLTSGMAVALITNFYPCLFAVILLGLYFRARRILHDCTAAAEDQPPAPLRGGWLRLLPALAVALFVIVFLGIGLESIAHFFCVPAMAFVFTSLLIGWLIMPGVRRWRGVVRVLYRNRVENDADREAAREALAGCRVGIEVSLLGGLAGALAGTLQTMTWATSLPSGLTAGIVLLCLSVFWMALVSLPLQAFAYRARGLLGAEGQEPDRIELRWAGLLAGCSTFFALMGLLLLFASFAAYADGTVPPASEDLGKIWSLLIPYTDWRALAMVAGVLVAGGLSCGALNRAQAVRIGLWLALLGGLTGALLRLIDILSIGIESMPHLLQKLAYTATPFFWALVLLVPLTALLRRFAKGASTGE